MHIVDLQDERNRIPFRLLRLHAEAIGDLPFLLSDDQCYSYGRANAIVNAYAHGLHRLGLQAGGQLLLYMHSCVDYVLLTLAANKLGALWVPVNTDYRGEWLVETINASRSTVLATDTDMLEKLTDSKAPKAAKGNELTGDGISVNTSPNRAARSELSLGV